MRNWEWANIEKVDRDISQPEIFSVNERMASLEDVPYVARIVFLKSSSFFSKLPYQVTRG